MDITPKDALPGETPREYFARKAKEGHPVARDVVMRWGLLDKDTPKTNEEKPAGERKPPSLASIDKAVKRYADLATREELIDLVNALRSHAKYYEAIIRRGEQS